MVTVSSEGLCGGDTVLSNVWVTTTVGSGGIVYALGYTVSISASGSTKSCPEDDERWIRYGVNG